MEKITVEKYKELERICERFAEISDPCSDCGSCISFDCCNEGRNYLESIETIQNYISDDLIPIYQHLKEIGWVDCKIREKRDILEIRYYKEHQEECAKFCDSLFYEHYRFDFE